MKKLLLVLLALVLLASVSQAVQLGQGLGDAFSIDTCSIDATGNIRTSGVVNASTIECVGTRSATPAYFIIGNYLIQWGATSITNTTGLQTVFGATSQYLVSGTITFAKSFANTNYVMCVNQNNAYPAVPATGVTTVTKAVGTCTVQAWETPNSNMQVEWIAIGDKP